MEETCHQFPLDDSFHLMTVSIFVVGPMLSTQAPEDALDQPAWPGTRQVFPVYSQCSSRH